MIRRLIVLLVVAAAGSGAFAFLVSNAPNGGGFVFEIVPSNRRPVTFRVDTESVPGVADPIGVSQQLVEAWNAIPTADDELFAPVVAGSGYNAGNLGVTFGRFPDNNQEIAWDADGQIMLAFGASIGTLGLTVKSVVASTGEIRDTLVIVNTRPIALSSPGATAEEVLRSTLLHELGHAIALGHTPVGMVNSTSFGLAGLPPTEIPTMYPFRFPVDPEEGGTLEADDRAAVTARYPENAGSVGSISGRVRAPSGFSINEIAVRAVTTDGAQSHHIGRLTNSDGEDEGNFIIPGVPPGGYRILIETVNGRANVGSGVLDDDGLGSSVFVRAPDEFWQPGDSFDTNVDVPTEAATVQVRAGRNTGSIEFVTDGRPLGEGDDLAGTLDIDDATRERRTPGGAFHLANYFVFHGTSGAQPTITAMSSDFVPQLRMLRPSDLQVAAESLPGAGGTATLQPVLNETGIYIVIVFALASSGAANGDGDYTLSLTGAGGGVLPSAPVVTGPSVVVGPATPAAQAFASPVCAVALAQIRLQAGSHEELWVDSLTARLSGTGEDSIDVDRVLVFRDANRNGVRDGGDPQIATATVTLNDETVTLTGLDLEVDPGETMDLLLCLDVTLQSVTPAPAGISGRLLPWLWLLVLLAGALAFLRPLRRRSATALGALLLATVGLFPLACGGGGGGGGNGNCNRAFDTTQPNVTFQVTVDAGGIEAFTPTTDPATPIPDLPPADIASAVLTVSAAN